MVTHSTIRPVKQESLTSGRGGFLSWKTLTNISGFASDCWLLAVLTNLTYWYSRRTTSFASTPSTPRTHTCRADGCTWSPPWPTTSTALTSFAEASCSSTSKYIYIVSGQQAAGGMRLAAARLSADPASDRSARGSSLQLGADPRAVSVPPTLSEIMS